MDQVIGTLTLAELLFRSFLSDDKQKPNRQQSTKILLSENAIHKKLSNKGYGRDLSPDENTYGLCVLPLDHS